MSAELSSGQETLLQNYFDKRCGFIRSFLARRLLKNNPEAQRYMASLEELAALLRKDLAQIEEAANPDVWDVVSRKIAAEELAAKYSVRKEVAPQKTNRLSDFWWGLSGVATAVAAGVASFMIVQTNDINLTSDSAFEFAKNTYDVTSSSASNLSPSVSTVSFGNGTYRNPAFLQNEPVLKLGAASKRLIEEEKNSNVGKKKRIIWRDPVNDIYFDWRNQVQE